MPEIVDISVADLLVDVENPRLALPNEGQRETLRALATTQGPKVRVLAQDILVHGLDPSELTMVMELEDVDNRFVVLDGNRRLTAIKAMENPEILVGAVSTTVVNAVRRLAKQYQESPLDSIPCVVVKNREEANHWIELRHTGERSGAGSVLWGSDESARFRARTGGQSNATTQALDFLESRSDLTPELRIRVKPSTLTRILESPDIRGKLGLEWSEQTLKSVGNEDDVAKALLHVVNRIIEKSLDVTDVYTKDQRTAFANSLPDDVVVARTRKRGHGIPLGSEASQRDTAQADTDAETRTPKPRDRLIPRNCALKVTDQRLRDIERELRRLSLENHPNAVAVLLRVFIELSVDAYIERVNLQASPDDRLSRKLQDVAGDLVARKKLTRPQAQPVRRASTKDSFLGPSVTLMHQWIHNQYMFPAGVDLRAHWDSLQPFLTAVWAP